ncbi:MAG: glycosyltransferase family 2 protein [Gemmatimonadaceae bacterium]
MFTDMVGWRRRQRTPRWSNRVSVSVVIAAYNARETLGTTLDSLRAQTHADWEAIVVDDGSTDDTAAIAARYAKDDGRISVRRQRRQGASVARNAAVDSASHHWLHFLDADDWVLPSFLEQLTGVIAADSAVDVIYTGARRFTDDGRFLQDIYTPEPRDLFPLFARFNAFTTSACLVRRSLVREVGAFDPSLRTCQDWDLWQRVLRSSDRVALVPARLAQYRLRAGSSSMSGVRLIGDGLEVIARGHRADPRVLDPLPEYAEGVPAEREGRAKVDFLCWAAGLELGAGHDAAELVPAIGVVKLRPDEVEPRMIAQNIVSAATLALPDPAAELRARWGELEPRVAGFLQALEHQVGVPGIAAQSFGLVRECVSERAAIADSAAA